MLHYFAYGSNLHPVRLVERVPSARLVDVVELGKHRLTFHKKGRDGSSKCNLFQTDCESDVVYGAIYAINPGHKGALDRFEGRGRGYLDSEINLRNQEKDYTCFTYFAQETHIFDGLKPYHWYKRLVSLGATYLQFPDSYLRSIEAVESVHDPDEKRRVEMQMLIKKIINHG